MTRKVIKKCSNCSFYRGDHSYHYCKSTLSERYLDTVYPDDEGCKVFKEFRKKKKNKNVI